jgi:hypothetical protein
VFTALIRLPSAVCLLRPKDARFSFRKVAQIFAALLKDFENHADLERRVLTVLHRLPEDVQRDFLDDPRFRITFDNYTPEKGWTLWMATPGPPGSGSRCVVLRLKLSVCAEEFAHYVIAHEFAHAFLRNGPWGEILDVEDAADALAASWGFSRPRYSGF